VTAPMWLSLLSGVLLGCFVLAVVVFVTRVVRYLRRHRRLANRRFLRRYRAANPTPLALPRPCPAGTRRDPAVPATPPPNRRAA
jgi:hypothetical protein